MIVLSATQEQVMITIQRKFYTVQIDLNNVSDIDVTGDVWELFFPDVEEGPITASGVELLQLSIELAANPNFLNIQQGDYWVNVAHQSEVEEDYEDEWNLCMKSGNEFTLECEDLEAFKALTGN